MDILHYEFIDGPDDSINGMLRTLVRELRYNRSMIPIEEFRQAMPRLRGIEQRIQKLDEEINRPRRDYIDEIMHELQKESDDEVNIIDDLSRATKAVVIDVIGEQADLNDFDYSTGRAESYSWLTFSGYNDKRPVDSCLIIVREVFRSICNKYDYVFIDLS